MITVSFLEAKVADYCKKSNALEDFFEVVITVETLDAEVNRIVQSSAAPDILEELFVALGNSPEVIAECIARPILVDKLLRYHYAYDSDIHHDLYKKVLGIHKAIESLTKSRKMKGVFVIAKFKREQSSALQHIGNGEYSCTITRKGVGDTEFISCDNNRRVCLLQYLEEDAFNEFRASIPPAGKVSPIIETQDAFVIAYTVYATEEELIVESIRFKKRTFDDWWEEAKQEVSTEIGSLICPTPFPPGYTPACYIELPPRKVPFCDKWDPTSTENAPVTRYIHTAVWTGAEMIVWGGSTGAYYCDTGGCYYPATDTWTPTKVGETTPCGRINHSAVWTGEEMIIYGGRWSDGEKACSDPTGAKYDPITDEWTPTAIPPDECGRFFHTAVWVPERNEMIIWGGGNYESSCSRETGGHYNPTTDTWILIPYYATADFLHEAVWTGEEMIVWGGIGPGYYMCGARYNPETDPQVCGIVASGCGETSVSPNWEYIPLDINTPEERIYFTAVWTGEEMIVWGGRDSPDSVRWNNGGRYKPSDPCVWQSRPTTEGAPALRAYHTAVWTGKEMIIWGGDVQYIGTTNTGGNYYPSTDSWVPTTTEDAPVRRAEHTAVWIGTVMIVWGGEAGGYTPPPGTGGIYWPPCRDFP